MTASSAVRIRDATVDDVPVLLELIRALAEYERLADIVVATEGSLRETLFGPVRRAEALLAETDAGAVGFALYFHNYSTFLAQPGMYLEDVFVRPECRGQGIGKRLLLEVARRACQRGCGRMEWAVLDWNERAIRFYESLGARPLSDWTVFRATGDALARLGRLGDDVHDDASS